MAKIIIDVREPEEFALGHFDGAMNAPLSKIITGSFPPNIGKDSELILYCRSGNRSEYALRLFKEKGFSNLKNGINQQQIEKALNAA